MCQKERARGKGSMVDGQAKVEALTGACMGARTEREAPHSRTKARAKEKTEVRERVKEVRAREHASTADSRGTWQGAAQTAIPPKGIVPVAATGATRQSTAITPKECRI